MHVFIIKKLAHPSYFCAEPNAQWDAFMQNRALNGMRSCKTDIAMAAFWTSNANIPDEYPWHRIAEDLRGGKGKKMKEGCSKSKPAPAAGFNPASTAGFNQSPAAGFNPAPAGGTNFALDTGSSQVHESLSTPAPAAADTGTDPHPGCACHAGRKKHRSTAEERDLINRLNRIEGQIRGIKKMLEADAYCPDVLTQVAAARCAMNSFAKVLLASHIRSCVIEDLEAGREETIEELVDTVQKLLKA